MEEVELIIGGIVSLIIAAILRNTLLKETIDQFFATDTSNWHGATAQMWELIPVVLIAAVIFAPVLAILDGIQ